jgi:S1-C subfamily serine protease
LSTAVVAGAGYFFVSTRPVSTEETMPAEPVESALAPVAPVAEDLEDVIDRSIQSVVSILSDEGRGSGFLVDKTSVITNYHVVGANETVLVKLSNGAALVGSVERVSEIHDLALVRLDRELTDRPALPLASVQGLRAGQEVYVIGSPMGVLESSVTRGIVSAVRSYEGGTLVQTDAAINPGNSGGPLLDRSGRVIGIATLKVTQGESIGFAVASDHAKELLEGGGTLASAGGPRPSDAMVAVLGVETQSPQETELLEVLQSGQGHFNSLARAVSRCPELSRDFEGKDPERVLFHLGEVVLEYVNQRRIYAANGRYIPDWNKLSCLQGAENLVVSCYQVIVDYDDTYREYLSDVSRRGDRPRARHLPEM